MFQANSHGRRTDGTSQFDLFAKTTEHQLIGGTEHSFVKIKTMRTELFKTRKQLRDVQHNLNRDIERLEGNMKFINVGLMPLAVALIAAILATVGMRRRRASAAEN